MYYIEKELKDIDEIGAYNVNGRKEKFTEQLWEWGFHDGHTFNLYEHLGKLILLRLKRFKEINCIDDTKIQLDEMIEAFEILEKHEYDNWEYGEHKDKEEWDKIKKGLRAFSDNFLGLWW